jgi:hypothetical protein
LGAFVIRGGVLIVEALQLQLQLALTFADLF